MKRAALEQATGRLVVETRGRDFTDITWSVSEWLHGCGAREGLLTVFIRHTSASLVIQENADPDVRADLRDALAALAPESRSYRHTIEGPDDMPAHIRTMLTATSLSVPVDDGKPVLGTWQAIYVAEHRASPHQREVVLHFFGEIEPRR